MNECRRRDFESNLAAEVDAWLSGEPTRRIFLKKLGQMTGLLAAAVLCAEGHSVIAEAAVDLTQTIHITPQGLGGRDAHQVRCGSGSGY